MASVDTRLSLQPLINTRATLSGLPAPLPAPADTDHHTVARPAANQRRENCADGGLTNHSWPPAPLAARARHSPGRAGPSAGRSPGAGAGPGVSSPPAPPGPGDRIKIRSEQRETIKAEKCNKMTLM